MIKSDDKTSQRLIDMIRVKYANQERIRIGFNRFYLSDDEINDDYTDLKDFTDTNSRIEMFDQSIQNS